jgi:glycosyltransferase involved in cell wall biosynthesis
MSTPDATFITLADIRTDARTLNIAFAVAQTGRTVEILAPDWSDNYQPDFATVRYFPLSNDIRFWKKWIRMYRHVLSMAQPSKSYWAEDLYSLPMAIRLASKFKSSFASKPHVIYDSREIYTALGPLSNSPLKQRVISLIERQHIHKVDTIIVSGALDGDYLSDYYKLPTQPKVVMNVPPYRKVEARGILHNHIGVSATTPIIIYQGVLLDGRGIDTMIRVLRLLPDAHFCILGDGSKKSDFMRLAEKTTYQNRIHFIGNIPYSELLEWTACADVGVCFIEPISFSYQLALPNKLFEYAMAGVPALVSDLPAMNSIIKSYPFGILIDTKANDSDIAQAIRELIDNKSQFKTQAEIASKIFNQEAQLRTIEAMCGNIFG